jgi:hypothetical protein
MMVMHWLCRTVPSEPTASICKSKFSRGPVRSNVSAYDTDAEIWAGIHALPDQLRRRGEIARRLDRSARQDLGAVGGVTYRGARAGRTSRCR